MEDIMPGYYNALKHTHSGLRWVLLALLIYAVYNAFSKKKGSGYTEGDRKLNLFTMVAAHTQLLIGLILYFTNPFIRLGLSNLGAVMKDSYARHLVVEHLAGMLIAIVLLTVGHAKSKRATGGEKHKKIFTFYLIALIVILASIPWPFRFPIASWF